jgi:hypothetical protein
MKGDPGGFRLTLVLCLTGWGLIFVPADVARPIRILVREALHPGQAGMHAALRQSRVWVMAWGQSVGQPGQPRRDHSAGHQVRVGRGVEHLDLRVDAVGPRRLAGPDEPERRLAVLDAPAHVCPRPAVGSQSPVRERAGAAQRRQRRVIAQHPGHERVSLAGQAELPLRIAAHQIVAVPPQAEVQVAAVAEPVLQRQRRE